MGLLKEFKEFAMRGNVVDMAVGIIIGAAFGKIVGSMVEDIVMPPIGKAVGNVDFTNLYLSLSDKVTQAQAAVAATNANFVLPLVEAKKIGPVLAYGNFITILINFIILAFCIFMMVKAINTMKKQPEPAKPAEPPPQEKLLTEIRDLLKTRH
jgi:large conductance mechanosensitive channel